MQCFTRSSGDRYCVSIPEGTSCAMELSSDKVDCVDQDGNVTTYNDDFNIDEDAASAPDRP